MKRIFLICLAVWNMYSAYSQLLTTAPAAIDFGTVMETETDSVLLTITNNADNYNITSMYFLGDDYDNPVFFVSPALTFPINIPYNTNYSFWVKCKPVHNISNNGELIIMGDYTSSNLKPSPIRVDLKAQGHFSNPYYNSTENLSEEALKTALKAKLALGYTSLGYTPARDAMFMSIDNQKFNGQGATVNTLECVYTGVTVTNYASRADAQNQGFNTEHTYPQSFFSSNEPMVSDLFHIFPTENNVNNTRGNSPFGNITGTGGQVGGGSQFLGGIFEPRDYHKGRCARAMMYFALRYQDYSCFFQPQEATLVGWHNQFPPNTIEQGRNASIYALQHNRNPFIDYPQFAQRIHKITSCAVSDYQHADFYHPETVIDMGQFGVPGSSPTDYNFVLVNTGNLPYQITNISLYDGTYYLLANNTDKDTVVQAHEAHQFVVSPFNLLGPVGGGFAYDTLYYTLTPPSPFTPSNIVVPISLYLPNAIEDALQIPFQLYPNPSNEQLTLKIEENAQLSLGNLLGQEQKIAVEGNIGEYKIDTKDIQAGVYFLHIQVKDKGSFAKVVIQH